MNDKNIADVADKAVDKLAGGFEAMARAFKSVAPQAWEVMVRQQVIEGVVNVALGVLVAAAGIYAAKRIYPLTKRRQALTQGLDWALVTDENRGRMRKDTEAQTDGAALALMLLLAGGVICLAGSVSCIGSGAKHIANPEYYAAMELVAVAK